MTGDWRVGDVQVRGGQELFGSGRAGRHLAHTRPEATDILRKYGNGILTKKCNDLPLGILMTYIICIENTLWTHLKG